MKKQQTIFGKSLGECSKKNVKKKKVVGKGVVTITFGDSGENHVGNQMIGQKVEVGQGFTYDDFVAARDRAQKMGFNAEIIDLRDLIRNLINTNGIAPGKVIQPAYIILIKDAVSKKDADAVFGEMNTFEWDTKYWDTRRKKVLNKHARSNVCFDSFSQEPDYKNGKGTIIPFDKLPKLKAVKKLIADIFGDKAKEMIGEGNRYNDRTKNGIGYHGDAERLKVVALRVNEADVNGETGTMPICWNWFYQSKPVGENFRLEIPHGCIYAMSEYATGFNWKYRSKYTLRHAAGGDKYTTLKNTLKTTLKK